jgi:hypothetical protein
MLEILAPQSDVQVLLAFLPAADLDRLAADLPGYDLLVASTGDLRDAPKPGPAPVVIAPGTKCKYFAWAALRPGPRDALVVTAAGIDPLDELVKDDPEMAGRVKSFKMRLGDGLPPQASLSHSAGTTAAAPGSTPEPSAHP